MTGSKYDLNCARPVMHISKNMVIAKPNKKAGICATIDITRGMYLVAFDCNKRSISEVEYGDID